MAELDEIDQSETLDFDDGEIDDVLSNPENNPFADHSGRGAWLYIVIGVVALALLAVVVANVVFRDPKPDSALTEVPIDISDSPDEGGGDFIAQADKIVKPDSDKPTGIPERGIENRKDIKFDPDKQPIVSRPPPRPITGAATQKPVATGATKSAATLWYAQVGAYGARVQAEAGQRQLTSAHKTLFAGKNFVILAAEVKGQTVYRLRVTGFATGNDAENFCKSARNNGVQGCYATK